jgi:hypothetical protein
MKKEAGIPLSLFQGKNLMVQAEEQETEVSGNNKIW